MRKEEPITRVKGKGPVSRDNTIETHPSFGMVGISRWSSSGAGGRLFGSSIQHKNTLTITISKAKREVGPYSEYYFTQGEVMQVELSQAQFAELVTSPNMGSGVPCTIRRDESGMVPAAADFSTRRDELNRGVTDRMQEFADSLQSSEAKVTEILSKKSIGKADRAALLSVFREFNQEITSNLPFLHKVIDEAVEKSVQEAKAEIDSFVTTGINRLGIEALANGASLGEPPEAGMLTGGLEEDGGR